MLHCCRQQEAVKRGPAAEQAVKTSLSLSTPAGDVDLFQNLKDCVDYHTVKSFWLIWLVKLTEWVARTLLLHV